MVKHNQNGMVNSLLLPCLISVILLIVAVVFGGWAYSGRQSYKNDVDAKINVAVASAKQQQIKVDDAQFATVEKSPLKAYNGPEAYGSIVLNYPKTWSAYIDDTGNGSALIDAYFSPSYVPALNNSVSVFSLRVQVQNRIYSDVAQDFTDQTKKGSVTIRPYTLPKVPNVVGLEVVGKLPDGDNGTEVILPVRTETIALWTDGTQYLNDFNTYILPNFSFSP